MARLSYYDNPLCVILTEEIHLLRLAPDTISIVPEAILTEVTVEVKLLRLRDESELRQISSYGKKLKHNFAVLLFFLKFLLEIQQAGKINDEIMDLRFHG